MFETMLRCHGRRTCSKPGRHAEKNRSYRLRDDPHVLINPVIIETAGEQRGYEGCLSVPGKTGVVTRPDYAKVKAYDEDMNEFILEGEGLLARAICHECEHLDGHMYVEKVEGELEDVAPYDEEE